MKKSVLALLCLSMSCILMAQETKNQKEAGISFSNLNNFGLTFKTGTENSMWRFTTLMIAGSNTDKTSESRVDKSNSTGINVRLGKEFRKEIAENLELRYGADLSFSYSQSKSESNDKTANNLDVLSEQTTYEPGIYLVFGLNYMLNESFVIGAEILPGVSYFTGTNIVKSYNTNNGEEVKSDINGFQYGLSNSSVLITLAYRF